MPPKISFNLPGSTGVWVSKETAVPGNHEVTGPHAWPTIYRDLQHSLAMHDTKPPGIISEHPGSILHQLDGSYTEPQAGMTHISAVAA